MLHVVELWREERILGKTRRRTDPYGFLGGIGSPGRRGEGVDRGNFGCWDLRRDIGEDDQERKRQKQKVRMQ